jgi:hypothetical protein
VLLLLAVRFAATREVLAAVFFTSLAISIWGAWAAPVPHFYLPGPRAWQLAAGGMLAAHTLAGGARTRLWPRASLAGLVLIGAGALLLNANDTLPGFWGTVPAAGALLLIAAGPGAAVNRHLLASRPMVFVGRLSYSLYLWHWPALAYARIVWGRELPLAALVGVIAFALAAAYLSYRLVEQPLRHKVRSRLAVPALLAGLGAFTLLGVAGANGRIASRLSGPAFTAWNAAVVDWHIGNADSIDRRTGFQTLRLHSARRATTLFIGDSHLQQYLPRISYLLDTQPTRARSVLFTAYAGCPVLPGMNALRQPRDCEGFFSYATAQALRPEVDTVVFAAFWELYLQGEYSLQRQHGVYGSHDPLRRRLYLDAPSTRAALDRFAQLIRGLVQSGRRVFIVLSNPTSPQFDPPALVPAQLRLSLQPPAVFAADRSRQVDVAGYERFVAPLMSRLRDIAARSGARILDPRRTLCTGMLCPAVGTDGTPLYIDSNHLRAAYARERATFLDETLLGPPLSVPLRAVSAAREQQEDEAAAEHAPDDSATAKARLTIRPWAAMPR